MVSEHLHIAVPESFPTRRFHDYMDAAKNVLLPNKGEPWHEFGGASNLITYRYRASIDYFDNYISYWNNPPSEATFEEIYQREREWFGAFVSGLSCIDSFAYSAYALSSHPKVLGLTFGKNEQRCNPKSVAKVLRQYVRAARLVSCLDSMVASKEWGLWVDLRNRMMHRSNLPRIIQGSIGSSPPRAKPVQFAATSSSPEAIGDENWIHDQCAWLSQCLGELLSAGTKLANGT